MRFMMLMIPKGYEKARADFQPDAESVAAMMKYNESLKKAGALISLEGFRPPAMGARVVFHKGQVKVVDGPFRDTKESVGGYWMIRVDSKMEAIEWAKKIPVMGDATVEIRQVQEIEDFPPDVRKAVAGEAGMQTAGSMKESM